MRNLTLLFAIFLMASFSLFAQKGVIHLSSAEDDIKLNENTMEKLDLVFNHSIIQSFTVTTKAGTFDEIAIPGAKFTGKIGEPKIPAYSELIEVPFGAEVKVIVKNFTTEEYDLGEFGINNPIIPAQPSISKSEDPEKVKFYYNESAYQSRSFTDFEMATVTTLGTMRGVRIAKLSVSPVNYNPAEGKIRVYNDIEVEVVFEKANKNMTETIQASTYSPYFEPVYNTLLNHKNVIDDHPDLTKYPVKMLILSDRMFEDALEPYIAWKTKKGFEVIVNYTDEGYSTVQDIKDWIIGHYNAGTEEDPAPSFCLFVGDVDQIPESQTGTESGKATDLYYFSQDGDYFPEMYYGRMSANNLTELQPQIDKTLYYEQYQFEDPTYLDDVTLIAGADGTWNPRVGQPTIEYGTDNYFNTSYGYSTINSYLSSYSGCYDNERISVSFINYTAHCSQGGWGDPSLSISDVYAMTNTNKYPLAVGNCCLSADFGYSGECVGEAWVRAENKGAVAYIGSSPSSYWFEDFYWSVGAFPISGTNDGYVPTVEETTMGVYDAMFMGDYKTTSALVFLGNLAVTEVDVEGYPQHSSPTYYWEAYNVLGDPSLVTYNTQGSENSVSHLPTMPIGQTVYEVTAEPGSYVAISKDGVLHGAGLVDETGTIQLDIEPVQSGGNVDIVVTKPQYQPYMTTVPAAAIDGAYIVVESYNNTVDYGQSINMDIALKNVGTETATGVDATISSDDANVTISNESFTFGEIAADATTDASAGVFTVQVANNLEDQYQTIVNIVITDDNDSVWNQSKTITVNAPVFEIGEMTLTNDDDANGRLDPGETAEINFTVNNVGHADAAGVVGTLSGDSPYFTVMDMTVEADINAAGSAVFTFNVDASSGAPQGSPVNLDFDVALNDYTDVTTEAIVIGQPPEIGVGDGTQESGNFPFYSYYENNRTQMLYLGSEIGAGEVNIQEIAFDFIQIDPEITSMTNLSIKFLETTDTEMGGAFVDMSGATEVLMSASFAMPQENGWFTFDIDDYVFDASSNLIVEILWGDNGAYGPYDSYYKVNSTTTDFTSVAYGYADSETPPAYDGNGSTRPNLMLYIEGTPPGEMFTANFTITDGENPIEGATVMIGSMGHNSDASGQTSFDIYEGSYYYSVHAEGYAPVVNETMVVDDNMDMTITLGPGGIGNLVRNLTIYPNPTKGNVTIELPNVVAGAHAVVMDLTGKTIISEQVKSTVSTLDLSNLSEGIYIIKVQNGQILHTNKIIVE